jgi:Kef-type K+ transport system membrane component KefB
MLIGYLLLVASLYAWGAMHFGSFAAICVASLGGALLGMSNLELKEKIAKGFESIPASIPVGILFLLLGMEVNFKEIQSNFLFLIVVFMVVIAAKIVGSWLAMQRNFNSFRERAFIGIGTLPQGEIGILVAAYLFSRGVVNPLLFHTAMIAVVLLTMLSPVLIKIVYSEFNTQRTSIPVSNPYRSPFSKGGLKGDCCRERS